MLSNYVDTLLTKQNGCESLTKIKFENLPEGVLTL